MAEQDVREQEDGVTDAMVADRAYAISQQDDAGTPDENWLRAEGELRRGLTHAYRPAAADS